MLPNELPDRTAYIIWPVTMLTTKSLTLPMTPLEPEMLTVPIVPRTTTGLLIAGAVALPVAGIVRPLEAQYWSTEVNGLLPEVLLETIAWSNLGAFASALAGTERTMVTGPLLIEADEPVPEVPLLLVPEELPLLAEGVWVVEAEAPVPEELPVLAEGVCVVEAEAPEELPLLAKGVCVVEAEAPVPEELLLLEEPVLPEVELLLGATRR